MLSFCPTLENSGWVQSSPVNKDALRVMIARGPHFTSVPHSVPRSCVPAFTGTRRIQPSFDDERRFAKSNYCWMGRESWHAIKKLLYLPFLILKVRYPAIKNNYCILRIHPIVFPNRHGVQYPPVLYSPYCTSSRRDWMGGADRSLPGLCM